MQIDANDPAHRGQGVREHQIRPAEEKPEFTDTNRLVIPGERQKPCDLLLPLLMPERVACKCEVVIKSSTTPKLLDSTAPLARVYPKTHGADHVLFMREHIPKALTDAFR